MIRNLFELVIFIIKYVIANDRIKIKLIMGCNIFFCIVDVNMSRDF